MNSYIKWIHSFLLCQQHRDNVHQSDRRLPSLILQKYAIHFCCIYLWSERHHCTPHAISNQRILHVGLHQNLRGSTRMQLPPGPQRNGQLLQGPRSTYLRQQDEYSACPPAQPLLQCCGTCNCHFQGEFHCRLSHGQHAVPPPTLGWNFPPSQAHLKPTALLPMQPNHLSKHWIVRRDWIQQNSPCTDRYKSSGIQQPRQGYILGATRHQQFLHGTGKQPLQLPKILHPAVGFLAPSQRYSTIEEEEVCWLWPEKKWLLEKVKEGVVVVPKRKLWA